MTACNTPVNPMAWRILCAMSLLVVLVLTSCSDEPAPKEVAEPVCDQYDLETCDCRYGGGFSYCRDDGTGYAQCECAIKEATTKPDVTELPSGGSIAGERDIELPLQGNEAYLDLLPGSYVLSWDLGIMGQLQVVDVSGSSLFIRTAPCAVTDVFESLDIQFHGQLRMLAHLPEDLKTALRERKKELAEEASSASTEPSSASVTPQGQGTTPSATLAPAKSGSGSVDLSGGKIPGLTLDLAGEYDIDVDVTGIEPPVETFADYLTLLDEFVPNVFLHTRVKSGKLIHFAFLVDMDPEVILQLSAVLEMKASLTSELEIFRFIAYLVTGQTDFVQRTIISPGLEVETYAIIGSLFELDANIKSTLQFEVGGVAYGGICYSRNWDDAVWNLAPDWFQNEKTGWENGEQQLVPSCLRQREAGRGRGRGL